VRGDVIDAVVDHQRGRQRVDQHLGLGNVAPQDRPAHPQAGGGSLDQPRQQARVERAHGAAAVQRQYQRRQHVQPVDGAWRRDAASQPARDARQVSSGQLGPAQPQRLDEQHPVLARQTGHQVLLIGPQLGVPVGESDAHDVAAAQGGRIGHRRHDPRRRGV
jgi:hypothetical protein